ncbi:hypothetical protein IDG46_12475 [Staphylococcus sp. EG-SA-13]|nr:hypothetical protein [Staphylococcus sp. EG-SA-13]
MEYEYEKSLKNRLLNLELDDYVEVIQLEKEYEELKEVYAKAKAWDNYLADVENSVREVTGNEDEVKWHVDYVINEYMEDK